MGPRPHRQVLTHPTRFEKPGRALHVHDARGRLQPRHPDGQARVEPGLAWEVLGLR
jgi:hypothetical protein